MDSTGALWRYRSRVGLANLMGEKTSESPDTIRPTCYEGQSLAALLGGILLILISFFTNYGYDDLLGLFSFEANNQIGVSLHIAALAALVSKL